MGKNILKKMARRDRHPARGQSSLLPAFPEKSAVLTPAPSSKKGFGDTQPQLTRIHALVQRIQKGDYPSQKILAAEWSKTPRTIQRDLDYIRDFLELPLAYDAFKYGYYFTEPVAKFPMVSISERELVSVFVAQKALRPYHGTPFERPLRTAFEKLVGSLQGEISVKWADLDSAISFRGIEANEEDMGALPELSGAIRNKREVEFEYWKLEAGGKLGEGGRPSSFKPQTSSFREISSSKNQTSTTGARRSAERGVRSGELSQRLLTSPPTGEMRRV